MINRQQKNKIKKINCRKISNKINNNLKGKILIAIVLQIRHLNIHQLQPSKSQKEYFWKNSLTILKLKIIKKMKSKT